MRRRAFWMWVVLSVALAACAADRPAAVTESAGDPIAEATAPAAVVTGSVPEATAAPMEPAERVFRLVPDESEARFLVEEILAGSSNTVVGSTRALSGEIRGAFDAPSGAQVGEVQVDLSTLRTDNSFRNRAIHDAILQTGSPENRFAVFRTTGIEGLPGQAEAGTTYPLRLTGDLTIHGVTRIVTFDAQVTAVSQDRLEGTASATLRYQDFDVFILRLPPQVASVGDQVTLEIDFVALAG